MAEWFVGPIMEKIINTCFEYLKDHVLGQTSMKKALERLQKLHPVIQSVVFAYNQEQIGDQNPALNRWLWQLRDAIDEADDLLDEFEYLKHKEQLTRNMEETKKRKGFFNTSFLIESAYKIRKIGERALKIDPNLKRLEEVVQNLDKVSAGVDNFLHLLENTKLEQQEQHLELYKTRETGSLPKNDLIGRGNDMDIVMEWLRNPANEHAHITATTLYRNISLLSIVGHGGVGKTTLLQHVYEDELTKEFDLKMWVCVSNNFDIKRVIADMLESLKMNRPSLESLDALQKSLKSEVMSKKFLLVLDDIWEEQEERDKRKWENVLAPMSYGSLGSKILVTTRMDSVASMIAKVIKKKNETLRLEGLKEDECLQLLNSHAFADVENPDGHKKLKFITGQIVKKLLGSPLAAKIIGGVLNSSLDEKHWIKLLNSDIVSAEPGQNVLLSILRLSYIFLPKPLKNCFVFCCIFPQDFKFDKNDLVRIWIALHFIQPSSDPGVTLEDVGQSYFDILVKKSFFDRFQDMRKTYYKMHDLLHELARSVSVQECFRIVDDKELSIPRTIRHLSIETSNLEVLRKIQNFKNLHSLFLFSYEGNNDFVDALTEIFKALKSLRLLYIRALRLRMIPWMIGDLVHLRYLRFDYTCLTQLPRTLSNLYHLQFIIIPTYISRSTAYDFLPGDMNNLFNLRYLKLPCVELPRGIGKLKFLQKFNKFYVKHEIGYRLEELEHMNELRQLGISKLENVKDADDVCSAKLCDKRNLMNLSLEWDDISKIADADLDEKVLDKLQPHNNLNKLMINKYRGARSAIWMNNMELISNLEYIKLDHCLEWQTLPPVGQLPFLKSLILDNMPKVKRLDKKFYGNGNVCVFPSLEVLQINKMEALEDWFDAAAAGGDCLFPCLIELYLKDCPNLRELPFLPSELKKLEIEDIGWKTVNWLQGTRKDCIQELTIKAIDELLSFPIEIEQWFLRTSLRKLYLIKLKSLQSLPSSFESLRSLEILHVKLVPHLQLLPNLPTSLKRSKLVELQSLQCLPSSLLAISSLEYLELKNIPLIKSLPDLPSSLKQLKLKELESLQCLPSSLSTISSLDHLELRNIPLLKSLPNLPSSLKHLSLQGLKSLLCLPFSFSAFTSLEFFGLRNIPLLKSLLDLPSCLKELEFEELESLQCLPSSLSTISSLNSLRLKSIPLLKSLPNLPSSLNQLFIIDFDNIDCLSSCLPNLSSLSSLLIENVPQLRVLPDLPLSLKQLVIINCHPELKDRYEKISGSDWHKIAHICHVTISNAEDQ